MNTEQKLAQIRAICEELIARDDHRGPGASVLDIPASPAAIAGWKATVAMIDCTTLILGCLKGCENHPLQMRELETADHFAFEIITAWASCHIWHQSAAQRAEAFLRALNLWEESK